MSDGAAADSATHRALARVMGDDRGRLLAALVGRVGDIQIAEDCLQGAVERALVHWERSGLPDNPRAWLIRVAHRRAIDLFRRDARYRARLPDIAVLSEGDAELAEQPEIPDDRLRLIFTCCHPALDEKSRVALTLRTLCGLSTEEIARAFLDKRAAMGQRLARAKRKIRDAGIAYAVPEGAELPGRLGSVLDVIYLVFNEGYAATDGAVQMRVDLCEEAIYLARMVAGMFADEPEAQGLLALLMLSHARRAARTSAQRAYVPLDTQDRSLWRRDEIAEGTALVEAALGKGRVGRFQLQAAIAAVHCEARTAGETDRAQIVALYRLLAAMEPGPVVALNLAVARAETEGPEAALAAIAPLAEVLSGYQPFHAARAALLARLGAEAEAVAAYDRALELTRVASERAFLLARRHEVGGGEAMASAARERRSAQKKRPGTRPGLSPTGR